VLLFLVDVRFGNFLRVQVRLGNVTIHGMNVILWVLKSHYDYIGQQNLTFFVPRTSISKLSSTFYAEFRYVYRIFLSSRVSKIQMNLNVRNSTLRALETGRNFPLKCRGLWLSPVFGFRYIPLHCPAAVCQHTWGPLALVPLFHSHNVLVKSFTVFVTDFAEIFWEKIQMWPQKVDFRTHIASHSVVRSQQDLHNILIGRCFVISKEVLANPLKWQPCISFSLVHVFFELSCISSLIWGPTNTPSLIFASLTFGKLFLKYSNPWPVLYIPFTKFFMRTSFMCKGGR